MPTTLSESALTFPIDPGSMKYFISRLLPTMPTRLSETFGLRLFVLMYRHSPGKAKFHLIAQDQTVKVFMHVDV